MIDWLRCSLPYNWDVPICGGHVVQIRADGVIERATVMSAHVRGSFDEHLSLRTVERGYIEFDGNPAKFLQGHNLVGSSDLGAMVEACMIKALGILGGVRNIQARDRERWRAGDFSISRIDVTQMFELPTAADVRAWLRAAGELARVRYRGRGVFEGTTLYFGKVAKGKRAAPWAMKLYAKGDEVNAAARGHKLPETLPMRSALIDFAANKLRAEVTLRRQELKRFMDGSFALGAAWNDISADAIFASYFGKLELGINVMLPVELEENLRPAMRLAYNSWKSGQDLRGIMTRTTFYRYRKQMLEVTSGAVDLAVPQAVSNVVPLRRILTLQPVVVPAWLYDTPGLYFRAAA